MQLPSFKISVPITAYINAPASTVSNLQDRLKSYGDVPSGILKDSIDTLTSIFAYFVYALYNYISCVLIGWTGELKEGTLVVFRSGPLIVLSLIAHLGLCSITGTALIKSVVAF